jgi:hypothetical protein
MESIASLLYDGLRAVLLMLEEKKQKRRRRKNHLTMKIDGALFLEPLWSFFFTFLFLFNQGPVGRCWMLCLFTTS